MTLRQVAVLLHTSPQPSAQPTTTGDRGQRLDRLIAGAQWVVPKFPMAKKAYRLELIGRSTRRERWLFLMAECTNDRQYMLEIYTMGDVGDAVWGKTVDKFIKDFKPHKK